LKKILYVLVIALILTACNNSTKSDQESSNDSDASNEEKYVLKLAHQYPEASLHHEYMEWFNEEVQQRSDGRLSLEIYSDAQLMPGDQEIAAILQGQIDMSHSLSSIAASFDPIWGIFDLPFLFEFDTDDPSVYIEARKKFINSENGGKKIVSMMEDKGLKVLSLSSTDMFGSPGTGNSDKKITNSDSINGLKIRTSGGSVVPDTLRTVGASGVAVSGAELTTALQQNVIDGLLTLHMYAFDNKLPIKSYTILPIVNYVMPVIISLEKFESLPKDLQEILIETGSDLEVHADKTVGEGILDVYEKFETELDVELYYPTEEEVNEWKEVTEPVWEEFENKVNGADKLIEEASEINEQYQK